MFGDQGPVRHVEEVAYAHDIAEYFGNDERLQDPTLRRDYFEHLEPEDFVGLTQQIASGVRGNSLDIPQAFDGQRVRLALHDIPDFEEREALLRDVWTGVRQLLADTTLEDERALEYAAMLTGLGITMIHPFMDGNGRTARTLSRVISGGVDEDFEEDMTHILGTGGDRFYSLPTTSRRLEHYVNHVSPIDDTNPYSRDLESLERIEISPSSNPGTVIDVGEDTSGKGIIEGLYHKWFDQITAWQFMLNIDEAGWEVIAKYIDDNTVQFGDAMEELANGEHGIQYMSQLHALEKKIRSDYVHRTIATLTSGIKVPLDESSAHDLARGGGIEQEKAYAKHLRASSVVEDNKPRGLRQKIWPFKRRVAPAPEKRLIAPRDQAVAQHKGYSKRYTK